MHHVQAVAVPAEVAEFQPERERSHPAHPRLIAACKLFQCGGMLNRMLFVVAAEKFSGIVVFQCVPADGVEFMVAHETFGRACFTHVAYDGQRFQNLRTTVYVVAEEDGHAVGVSPRASAFFIAQTGKQGLQFVCTAVYIAYYIVTIQHSMLHMPRAWPGYPQKGLYP